MKPYFRSQVRPALALFALVATLVLPGLATAKDWTELRVGVDAAYKPFTYKTADGKLTGFDIDIANALCMQMKIKCSFVEQNWDGIIPALNARKFDAIISSMSITDDRRRAVDFTNKYYETPTRIVAKAGSSYSAPESLKDKRVGVLKASVQEKYALAVLAPAGASVVSYDTQEQVYLDLKSGRLDATVADAVEAGEGFLKSPDGQGFVFIGPELRDPKFFGYGAGIAVRKTDSDLRDKLNEALKEIRANGVYKKLNDKYFSFDVYGS
jgi:arginine/ornithine transport system substrate-binding protein